MKGGNGAAQYMQQVAGDMNAQVAGPNGALKYTPVSGGALEQMAVPALLVLANNALSQTVGGNMLQQAIVPATLILASNMLGKKGMRKMSPFTKRRSSRRRNNRRKRMSRRFRRGPR
jgi:hypothetical protein